MTCIVVVGAKIMPGKIALPSGSLLKFYSVALTIAFVSVVLIGARKPELNVNFDQITVHRINIVEPDGTTRMVLSDHAEFPGAFFMGKEYPRADRSVTGMLFNDDEGTENGGLIFGGNKDRDGTTHSWGHLSFDQYQRDQTMVLESTHDGSQSNVFYAVNDDTEIDPITPERSAEWQRIKAMSPGPERVVAAKAYRAQHPGAIVNRAYFGRGRDNAVTLQLKDPQGRTRLVAKVDPDGTPRIDFLDEQGKIVRSIGEKPE
jgi:hypothetical protein